LSWQLAKVDTSAIFFLRACSRSSSRATFLRTRKVTAGSRVFLTGRAASSSYSPPLVAGAAAMTRIRLVASLNSWREAAVLCRHGVPHEFCSGWRRRCCSRSRYMARRKSGSREGLGDARDRPFAKPCAAWHICQICSLICQVA